MKAASRAGAPGVKARATALLVAPPAAHGRFLKRSCRPGKQGSAMTTNLAESLRLLTRRPSRDLDRQNHVKSRVD